LRRRYRELKVAREPMRMDRYARGIRRPTQSIMVAKVCIDRRFLRVGSCALALSRRATWLRRT
jgi:hypothetical protein